MAESKGVLGQIVAAKRDELRRRFDGVSLDGLRSKTQPSRRSLASALARPGARFILEIKKASPSSGAIRPNADPAQLARDFAGVADGLSVLCDTEFFGGSLVDLAAARRFFDGPILAKDFFLDLRQVAEARIAGADAVLVMLSLLDDAAARAMIAEARRFGMDALVEVHDESEMHRALALDCPLIGINNRDLASLNVDLATTERLARYGAERTIVSESGIHDRHDVDRLAPLVDGFLVGSSLMRSDNPAQHARALVFGRIKLCGLNRGADVRAARPAAFAGFVFVPDSPRQVTATEATPLVGTARSQGMSLVGVFRDAPQIFVTEAVSRLGLDAVQLHGNEDTDYIGELRRKLPAACEIWTAVDASRPFLQRTGDRLLFDQGAGGSGQSFDWERIRGHPQLAASVVAGGIGAHNARSALSLGAYALDVGSSLDVRPGRKSARKIGDLFDALRTPARTGIRLCA